MAIASTVPNAESVERLYSATRAEAITPSATATFEPTRAVLIGTGGNLVCNFSGAPTTPVTLTNIAAGFYPFSLVSVSNTSTAANMTALR